MSRRSVRGKAYKKTTSRQYNVMIRDIGQHLSYNGAAKSKGEHYLFWCELRDKLNAIGPPTRNITEWKKVWNDCQRSRKRREHFRLLLKEPKKEPIEDYEEEEEEEEKMEANEEESYINDDAEFQNESSQHSFDPEMNLVDESASSFTIYTTPTASAPPTQQQSNNNVLIPNQLPPLYRCPRIQRYIAAPTPPSEPPGSVRTILNVPTTTESSTPNLSQEILKSLQYQMEHQSKLLEHMSQLSTNMTALMERQVMAIERQTVAVRRQAIAMEHHTLVMNSFVDMIRDKMPKYNNNKTANLSNGKL